MIQDLRKVIQKSNTLNIKHIKAIKLVVRPRVFRIIYLDDRTRGFDNIKPFAMDHEGYYVCCPCCFQIEKVNALDFKNGSKAQIQCKSKKNSEIYKINQDELSAYSYKMAAYTVNLDGWQ